MINISGLAMGLACFIMIFLFVFYEFSYDRAYENADQVYRVVQQQPGNVFLDTDYYAVTPAPLARTLTNDYPEITAATTLQEQNALLSFEDSNYMEKGLWADEHFFDLFPSHFLEGNPQNALKNPRSIVLTRSLAEKLFNIQDPVGQTLQFGDQEIYTVSGVIRDVPPNTSLQYSFITSIHSQPEYIEDIAANNWTHNWWYTFFELAGESDASDLQPKLQHLANKQLYSGSEDLSEGDRTQYLIQPLTDLHFGRQYNKDVESKGDIVYVYLFIAIAFIVLLLACVNYINLATARSFDRTREVGMRKVVGAQRYQLIGQFLGESLLTAFIALFFALVLVELLLPVFSHLVERPLQVNYFDNIFIFGSIALVAFIGMVCGSYPALFLTSIRPHQVLKGTVIGKPSLTKFRNFLIIGQYSISIALIAGSLLVHKQMNYIYQKDPGYERKNVVTVRVNDQALQKNYETIREEWLRNSHIEAVTYSYHLPTSVESRAEIENWEGNTTGSSLSVYINNFGYDFREVFGIDVVAGQTFSKERGTNNPSVTLINETAARAFGWTPQEAVGKNITARGENMTVIGVLKDFNMQSMHMLIKPMIVLFDPSYMGYISARVTPGNLSNTIESMEQTVKQFSAYPIDYQFLDNVFNQIYKEDRRLGETLGFFTVLALFIASLGLFGLVAYVSEQRTKEIGIRKVLGATVIDIVQLLSKDFLRRVIIGFVIAIPIAWYAMNRWLEDFAYRIEIGPGIFLLAGGIAILIALLTVSWKTIRMAFANPVNSLRNE